MIVTNGLPTDPADKLTYLERAARHGDALRAVLAVGAPIEPVLAYVGANPDLAAERAGTRLAVRYGDLVRWDVTLDEDDRVAGYASSGYQPLMAALGVDFKGRLYVEGNG
jgi:hypothetical protein